MYAALLSDPEVAALLDDAAQARAMVRVERALAVVEGRLGVIEPAAAGVIDHGLDGFAPDLAGLARGTGEAGVPVPALVGQLRGRVGGEAAGFVHWGATSQDIIDTALVLQLREALALLDGRLANVITALAELADVHRATVAVARTRFQQAVPTSIGLKAAVWLAPLLRHRTRLAELRPRLLVVQFGGAAGNLSALGGQGIAVMAGLARELGLGCPALPWHAQRDTLAELASWLALVTGSLGKLGLDLLLLAQSEVGEVREARGGGSSTMPQKANPVLSEALVTLARRNATLLAGMFQAMPHALERDGAAWQIEWAVLPDMVETTAAALAHAGELARTVVVDPARARAVLDAALDLPLAEAVSFALAEHMPRARAQELVKQAAREATASGRKLLDVMAAQDGAGIDWERVRAQAEHPACNDALIDRVLAEVAAAGE
ncbi:MAG: 3-carboxy-cis,cis-muconate cycloisomerase [Geminicoccaceae bacterium]